MRSFSIFSNRQLVTPHLWTNCRQMLLQWSPGSMSTGKSSQAVDEERLWSIPWPWWECSTGRTAGEVAGSLVLRPHHGNEFAMTELNSTWKFDSTPQILVPIANGSDGMEIVVIIDILRRVEANLIVASIEDELEIVASGKEKLIADILLDEAIKLKYDLSILPGGLPGAQALSGSEKLINLLREQAESSKVYGAIGASQSTVLEPHGLLTGKKATACPALCSKLSDQSYCRKRVVVDGNVITSRGTGTTMEFVLAIVEKLYGRQKSIEVAESLVFM